MAATQLENGTEPDQIYDYLEDFEINEAEVKDNVATFLDEEGNGAEMEFTNGALTEVRAYGEATLDEEYGLDEVVEEQIISQAMENGRYDQN